MGDVTSKLDQIVEMVEAARPMPLSASCMVNRVDLLAGLEELRALLPAELEQAQWLLGDRDAVMGQGREQAANIIAEATAERSRLLSESEMTAEAKRESERLLAEAQQDADARRAEVDDYVDGKLANFEVILQKTIAAVERGREKVRGRQELAELNDADDDELPEL